MALMPTPGGPPPGGPPMPGSTGMPSQGQPPIGSSPATPPTPNPGNMAQGQAGMSLILKVMERVLPMVGAETEQGKAVLKAMDAITKALPQGSVPPAMENNFMQGMMQRRAQMAPQIAAMQRPGMPPGGAPPTPPMPAQPGA